MAEAGVTWFETHTRGAPELLRRRAADFLQGQEGTDLVDCLAEAGRVALHEAMRRGRGRDAALDLLAADALITLALLAQAERQPQALGTTARRLRQAMAAAA